jgi:hypothetical protein
MYSKFIALALCVASVAGAQVRTKAIELANKTAATANARTEALGTEQQKVAEQTPAAQDSAKKVSAGAVAAGMTSAPDVPGLSREVFQYDGGGRRDPFTSLSRTGALRPHISELQLVVVIVASNGSKSVATIRDSTTKEQYVVKVGDSLGRYRVVKIDQKTITFAIEEFGFSRQEKLSMATNSKERNQ